MMHVHEVVETNLEVEISTAGQLNLVWLFRKVLAPIATLFRFMFLKTANSCVCLVSVKTLRC